MNTNKGIFKTVNRWLVAVLLLTGSSTLLAAPLNLNLLTPDINAPFMNTNYDAGTDIFTASADFGGLTLDGVEITDGSFTLSAIISAGGILNSGDFTIFYSSTSTLSSNPALEDLGIDKLLTGNLADFGFANDGSEILEFVFNVTGGDLAPDYDFGASPGVGGIILSVSGYDNDNFNTSFAHTGYGGFADIAPIPVPAAFWLFGSGLLGLAGIARRRS